jgi:probable lipoprotein NlpC
VWTISACAMPYRPGYDRDLGLYPDEMNSYRQLSNRTKTKSVSELQLRKTIEPWLGTPYKFGQESLNGTDCSGFVRQVFRKAYQLEMPRSSHQMFKIGSVVSRTSLKVGDLVFFGTRRRINHTGIYLGNNEFVHASTSSGVRVDSLNDKYWKNRYRGARRYE